MSKYMFLVGVIGIISTIGACVNDPTVDQTTMVDSSTETVVDSGTETAQ